MCKICDVEKPESLARRRKITCSQHSSMYEILISHVNFNILVIISDTDLIQMPIICLILMYTPTMFDL